MLRKLHPLKKSKMLLTKHQQGQKHLLHLKLLRILLNPLISPSQMKPNSMGHQLRFQGLIPWQPVHRLHLLKVHIFLKPDTSHNASILQEMFWKFHPNQPVSNIPFNSAVVYDRQGIQGMNINRKWVTYNAENKTSHCSFCLMYTPEKNRNMQMIQGCSDWRHITTRLFEHEKSHCHKHSTDAYFLNVCERPIKHNLLKEQLSLRTQQVLQRRSVFKRVID